MTDADVETSSAAYARRFEGPVGRWFLDVQARTTLELLRPRPGLAVLDVGGGHGQLTGALVEAGCDVTVYASADSCVERVREWVDAGRARFRSGPLLHAPGRTARSTPSSRSASCRTEQWRDLLASCAASRQCVIVDCPPPAAQHRLERSSA